jgi:hypothetical protein
MSKVQIVFSSIFIVLLLIACDQKPKNPVAEYGNSLIGSYKGAQDAGEIANLDAVKKAVAAYHAANDKYPQSLDDIKDVINAPIDLSKYDYNPGNGSVTLKKS